MKYILTLICSLPLLLVAQYHPQADMLGTNAIAKDSSLLKNWAQVVISFNPGLQDTADALSPEASYGFPENALFVAEGNSADIVSLGDGGEIVLGFEYPIRNGLGPDFAVFENSFSHTYLEFAFIEVSTNGVDFVRFPSHYVGDQFTQVGSFGNTNPEEFNNLAGKYIQGFGTPFDLEDLKDSTGVNLDSINFVKVVDVVGSIHPLYGTTDAFGNYINEPYPTAFESGGFDLDAVGVIHENRPDLGFEENEIQLTVYPNPTTGKIFIQSSETIEKIQVLNLSGQIVMESMETQINFASLGLEQWVYFLHVYLQNGQRNVLKALYC